MTAEGQKRTAERAAARKRMGAPTDAVQNQSLERALHHHGPRSDRRCFLAPITTTIKLCRHPDT